MAKTKKRKCYFCQRRIKKNENLTSWYTKEDSEVLPTPITHKITKERFIKSRLTCPDCYDYFEIMD